LATAYQVSGNTAEWRQALDAAMRAEPTNADVAWTAGNFFLAHGATEEALRQFRLVLESKQHTRDAIELAWRATGDPATILHSLLPPAPGPHLEFLRLMIEQNNAKAAADAWARLVALGQPFEAENAFPYVQWLLDHDQPDDAWRVWSQLGKFDKDLNAYVPSP